VISNEGYRFDLRVVPPECYGNLLQHFTGSKDHNVALREAAVKRGLSVSEYGVKVVETGEVVTHAEEADLYELLGYQFIPPELRENLGELEAARLGALPTLVELRDLKGDLHSHTTWSDGTTSVEEMALAAIERGYEYLAICDHTPAVGAVRGLTADDLRRQALEIADANEALAPFRVLRGTECDILPDGHLDLPDSILAELDWVQASVHGGQRLPKREQTKRVEAALRNPYVSCLSHPKGRYINRRPENELDVDRLIEVALEEGVALEVNGLPDRLDLRDVYVRQAVEAGVKIVCSTDAHSIRGLANMELSVATARRGWATAADVVNTASVDSLLGGRRALRSRAS